MGLFQPRPGPLTRLSVGRGRACRNIRGSTVSLFRVGAVERQRSAFEGASFRPYDSEGNHGEDVKEYYFYLDSTPTHSYMKYLYKYPQRAFPYEDLVKTNRRRSRLET